MSTSSGYGSADCDGFDSGASDLCSVVNSPQIARLLAATDDKLNADSSG